MPTLPLSRRTVLQGLAALPLFNIGCAGFGLTRARQIASGAKVRIAIIGCGDWGGTLMKRAGAVGGCECLAFCEPDPNALKNFYAKAAKTWHKDDLQQAKVYADYRTMFDELGEQLDAVFIATPNHHHALPALLAMRRGIHVFVEKPMAHTMEEVILMDRTAREMGVVLRVGNKGHYMEHRPLLSKYLKEGVIGEVTEVFSFSDRPNTMLHRPPSCPPPKGMDWDLWCGGSPICENYIGEGGRVGLHPHDWHSWIDYGNGSLGNMGTHVLDAPFQCMDMWKALPSKVAVRDVAWGCKGAWNKRGTLDFTIPARPGWNEITLHWNDGIVDGIDMGKKYMTGWYNRVHKREHTNFPAKLLELEKQWKVTKPLAAFGTVFVGTKGMIYEEFHDTLRIFPEGGKYPDFPVPAADKLDQQEHRIVAEFLEAVRGKPGADTTDVDFSTPLAKTLMLANSVYFAGRGTYAFDGEKTDNATANTHLNHDYRNGWDIH